MGLCIGRTTAIPGVSETHEEASEDTNLEECQKIVQLSLLRASIKTHAACVQQHTNHPDPEKVIGHINLASLLGQWSPVRWKRDSAPR